MFILENDYLRVEINSLGAELWSIFDKEISREYLWQGDEKYWKGRSPNLFPFIGRLHQKKYTYKGREYDMGLHGFVRDHELTVEKSGEDYCEFSFKDTSDTYKIYPFKFDYRISYELKEKSLRCKVSVTNTGEERMFFEVGGHPGFNVPMEDGLGFEDYSLIFPEAKDAKECLYSENVLSLARTRDYKLLNQSIPLKYELFDRDAIILKDSGGKVRIASDKAKTALEIEYEDFKYVGFWQAAKKECPYLCVEPWSTLPGREGVVEDISAIEDILSIGSNETYTAGWRVSII